MPQSKTSSRKSLAYAARYSSCIRRGTRRSTSRTPRVSSWRLNTRRASSRSTTLTICSRSEKTRPTWPIASRRGWCATFRGQRSPYAEPGLDRQRYRGFLADLGELLLLFGAERGGERHAPHDAPRAFFVLTQRERN